MSSALRVQAEYLRPDPFGQTPLGTDNEGRQSHAVDFEYDTFSRLTRQVQDVYHVDFEYDDSSNRTRVTYPSYRHLGLTYNTLNQPTVHENGAGALATYTYGLNHRINRVQLATNTDLSITFNAKGQEDHRDYSDFSSTYFTADVTSFDAMGQVKTETVVNNSVSTNIVYAYDELDRVVSESKNSSTKVWTYDPVGSWLSTNQNGTSETRTVNGDNEYLSINALAPIYDDKGNLTLDEDKAYSYDWQNRLVEVREIVGGASIATYTYDALNRRVIQKDINTSVETRLIYDGQRIVEEYKDDSFDRAYYYGPYVDDRIAMEDNTDTYYYLKDRQYSVMALSDSAGNIRESYEYSTYGIMKTFDANGVEITESAYGNVYGFQGRRWDKNVELWNYRQRVYDPSLGRFMQRDPAGYVDGLNLYAYVRNNPLSWVDPMGTKARNLFGRIADWFDGGAYKGDADPSQKEQMDS